MDVISRLSQRWLHHIVRIILSCLNDQDQINFGAVSADWWRILNGITGISQQNWTKGSCRRLLARCDTFDHYQKLAEMIKEPFRVEPSVWEKEFVWDRDIAFVGDSLIVGVCGGVIHVWDLWSGKGHQLNTDLKIDSICACDGQRRILVDAPQEINRYYIIDIHKGTIVDQFDGGPYYKWLSPNVVVLRDVSACFVQDSRLLKFTLRWLDTKTQTQHEILIDHEHSWRLMDLKDDNLICFQSNFDNQHWVELRPLKCLQQVAHRFEFQLFSILGYSNLFIEARDLFDDNNRPDELNWIPFLDEGMSLYRIRRYGKYVLAMHVKRSKKPSPQEYSAFKVTVYGTDVSPPTQVFTHQKKHKFRFLKVDVTRFHMKIWSYSRDHKATLMLLDFLPDCK